MGISEELDRMTADEKIKWRTNAINALKAYHADIAGLPFKDGDRVHYSGEDGGEPSQDGTMRLEHARKTVFGIEIDQDVLYFVPDSTPTTRLWIKDMERWLRRISDEPIMAAGVEDAGIHEDTL